MVVISKQSLCLYLSPQAFSSYFLPRTEIQVPQRQTCNVSCESLKKIVPIIQCFTLMQKITDLSVAINSFLNSFFFLLLLSHLTYSPSTVKEQLPGSERYISVKEN